VLWGSGSGNNGRGEDQGSGLGRASGEAWQRRGESWAWWSWSGCLSVFARPGVCDRRAGKRSHALRALCIVPNRGLALPTVAAGLAPRKHTSVYAGRRLSLVWEDWDPRDGAEGSPLGCAYQDASGERPS
jgi:hypothetical protein